MAQPTQPFHFKVHILVNKFLVCHVVNLFSCCCHVVNLFSCSLYNIFLSLAEVAHKLGYDDLTAVTTEDMALEVRKNNFFEGRHVLLKENDKS